MKKKIGSACLVAGTAIGAGMIALPMVLAQLGIALGIIMLVGVWAVIYYSALLGIEVNLRHGRGAPLGVLGRNLSGKGAEWCGNFSLNLLSYSLLAAYMYGGASVVYSLARVLFNYSINILSINTFYALGLGAVLLLSVRMVDYVNRVLFVGLLGLLGFLIVTLLFNIDVTALPMLPHGQISLQSGITALPILFTAFGFHVVFHSITNYCDKDPDVLRKSLRIGSLIPFCVYVAWTIGVLGVIYLRDPALYAEMARGGVDVGRLVSGLCLIMTCRHIQLVILLVSLMAILTSIIGVGLGLVDSVEHYVSRYSNTSKLVGRLLSVFLVVAPPYIVAILVPGAFIYALSFAGMILVSISIFIPLYLLYKSRSHGLKQYYAIVDHTGMQLVAILFGVGVLVCELWNVIA